jgi:DNA-binding LacI/PurR family transcriptional regulator
MLKVDRTPLASRFAATLKEGIEEGLWKDWLPGTRELSRRFGVSRVTCDQAMRQLEHEGWVERRPSVGVRIAGRGAAGGSSKPASPALIAIITPHPMGQMRPHVALWLDELREHLSDEGLRLIICHSPRFYRAKPEVALAANLRRHPSACWLLLMTTRETQEWFSRSGVPCMIVGTPYEGVELASVSSDLPAIGRHAARSLIAGGHRSIGLLLHRLPGIMGKRISAGDQLFAAGFLAEAEKREGAVAARVFEHEESLFGVNLALQAALAEPAPCTGLVVANSHCYLSAASLLAARGLQVPRDVSLICRDDDPFFEFIHPRPTCYRGTWELMLKAVFVQVRNIVAGKADKVRHVRLFPTFVKGASLGPPKAR